VEHGQERLRTIGLGQLIGRIKSYASQDYQVIQEDVGQVWFDIGIF